MAPGAGVDDSAGYRIGCALARPQGEVHRFAWSKTGRMLIRPKGVRHGRRTSGMYRVTILSGTKWVVFKYTPQGADHGWSATAARLAVPNIHQI